MIFSTQSVTSDGSLVLIDISFDYITRDEVSVFFDSVPTTDWSWVGDNEKKIAFSPAVPVGVEVLVKRTTDISKLRHEFSLGAAFIYKTLDEDLKQVLHIAQEASEANFSGEFFVPINMHGNRITALADGVDPQDAATIGQLSGYDISAGLSADAAAQSAIDAADASRLVIGTVNTGAPGTPAAVDIVGPAGGQALNFQLPRGPTGPGVVVGGTTGQVLRKVDGADFNATWVTLVKGDVSLSNVDNTSDANKPISTAQAAGLVSRTSATGSMRVPAGTTGQRPGVPVYGDQRANSTLNSMEWYNGTDWVPMNTGEGSAKAWVNFNGTGTIAIRKAFNVSSITDIGVGDYGLNFSSPMADANYAIIGTGGEANEINVHARSSVNTPTVNGCAVESRNGIYADVSVDCAFVYVAIFS